MAERNRAKVQAFALSGWWQNRDKDQHDYEET